MSSLFCIFFKIAWGREPQRASENSAGVFGAGAKVLIWEIKYHTTSVLLIGFVYESDRLFIHYSELSECKWLKEHSTQRYPRATQIPVPRNIGHTSDSSPTYNLCTLIFP